MINPNLMSRGSGPSPFPLSRQDTPYLRAPGPYGLPQGVRGGQQLNPSQQFYGRGGMGTAAPASIPGQGNMWSVFGGSGGAPSSFAGGGMPMVSGGQMPGQAPGFMGIPNTVNALGNQAVR